MTILLAVTEGAAMTAVSAGTLFVDLDDAERSELPGRLRPFSVAADEVLFRQDTPADRVYLVTAGRPAVHHSRDETIVPLAVTEPPSVLGEPDVSLDGERRRRFAVRPTGWS